MAPVGGTTEPVGGTTEPMGVHYRTRGCALQNPWVCTTEPVGVHYRGGILIFSLTGNMTGSRAIVTTRPFSLPYK
jgi:hypothetical protein